ncbi:hypothetical protein CLHUN_02390 [Ruminiclostridium hungatei]|uniref:Uncharacterized protein n=1 Tax=Ruminiclostridium hungatei TaxID=48256 RepID=A0A1V4SRL2_RUMHU|nr:hypothetical protein [Ruminiclostridium hungatei]OPX46423.1 hypothetical protein CLHUN_02390 [Ruminiclostridium hungatei]
MKGHYAIEIIGCRKQRFVIKKVAVTGLILPVNGKAYRTLEKAQTAAADLGLIIEKVGDCYEIL